jgi:hypothetical protein
MMADKSETHRLIDKIMALANSIASDAEAAVDCRPAVLVEIEHQLANVQRRLYDEITSARLGFDRIA